ncbi:unnamed protein product [Brachionus calyciflorus]|uniref:G-protein coupled receptors family 1 profile domain-containing protein n=1 Tax=Brachionus calyciflorus TaxID=104777 RepID=A0A814IMM4_9BILA|nr:unnamed protein product [Brachionus calyciflorus]
MTPNAIQLLSGKWFFKSFLCKFWFASDVLFSTASILHLCCISIDRYLSVSDRYAFSYNAEDAGSWRVRLMIGGCWVTSALLSFIPIFTGIYTTQEQLNIIHSLDYTNGHCAFKVNLWYRFLSSFISFWMPCVALVIFYKLLIKKAYTVEKRFQREDSTIESLKIWKSEFRLIRTLGFVISVFVLCWFFFFLRYTLLLEDVLFWIGYFNSMVNPFLYNYTNQEFRRAFKSLWFGGRNFRSGSSASYQSRKTTIDYSNQIQRFLSSNTQI